MRNRPNLLGLALLTVSLTLSAICPSISRASDEQNPWINLFDGSNLDAWRSPHGQWEVVGDVTLNPENNKLLLAKPGKGILYNGKTGKTNDLITKESFEDIELKLEFLVSKKSNSGVKFMTLYEVQIYDSWQTDKFDSTHLGGIYHRFDFTHRVEIDKGSVASENAAKKPGEWQTLEVIFQAPRFDAAGRKISNARFVKVVVNGKVVQRDAEAYGVTGAAWWKQETSSKGPLMIQGDHGPVAMRNIRVRPWTPELKEEALVRPTPGQTSWQNQLLGLQVNLGLETFQDKPVPAGKTPEMASFQLKGVDANQWCQVAKEMGAGYLMFPVKEESGFCLWPTKTTSYRIDHSPYREGKGDIVKEVVEAGKKASLPVGIVVPIRDQYDPHYNFPAIYTKFLTRQLNELTHNYGPLYEVRFGPAEGCRPEEDRGSWTTLISQAQPKAIIVDTNPPSIAVGPTVRPAAAGESKLPATLWDVAPRDPGLRETVPADLGQGYGTRWLPTEATVRLRPSPFFKKDEKPKPVAELVEIYEKSVGHGANLVVEVAADRDGKIPAEDVARLKEFTKEVERRYGKPAAKTSGAGPSLELKLPKAEAVRAVRLREDDRQGQRVRKFELDAFVDGKWVKVAEGTTIGHQRLVPFKPVSTDKLRLRVSDSLAPPVIQEFATFGWKD